MLAGSSAADDSDLYQKHVQCHEAHKQRAGHCQPLLTPTNNQDVGTNMGRSTKDRKQVLSNKHIASSSIRSKCNATEQLAEQAH